MIGFLSNLATAECVGLLMETFDTSDLQPGVNNRHRPQSLASVVRRRRTNYSSFPRVSAGFFVAQTIGFLLAAAATGVGGVMTRRLGAQLSTGLTAAVLFGITLLLYRRPLALQESSGSSCWRVWYCRVCHEADTER